MQVQLDHTGKKFDHKWVFRDLTHIVDPKRPSAITGKNGSGKSTLLLMLAGYLSPSQGHVRWMLNDRMVQPEQVFHFISLATPHMELIEEFTLPEMIRFQQKFRPFTDGLSVKDLVEISTLGSNVKKPIRQFSSGMKQRVKLLLAIMVRSELMLLDEPCTHLDREGIAWYHELLKAFVKHRSLVVASNHNPEDYPGCNHFIRLG